MATGTCSAIALGVILFGPFLLLAVWVLTGERERAFLPVTGGAIALAVCAPLVLLLADSPKAAREHPREVRLVINR